MDALVHRGLFLLRLAARRTGLRLAVFAILSLIAAWPALERAGSVNDFRDAHMLQSYEAVGARTLGEYGQFPLWDPYACGGLYAFGGPQTRVASPTIVLSALFGARRAEALLVFLFLLLGMEGFFRYARTIVPSALGPLLAAPVFALNGYFAVSWTLAWINFFGFELLPWLLLGTGAVVRGRAWGLWMVAGVFAFLIGFGGTYPVPLGALFVALEAGRHLLSRRVRADRRRTLSALTLLCAAALFTLGLCAYRLWPVAEVLQSGPRIMAGRPGHSWAEVSWMAFWLAPPPNTGNAWVGITYLGPPAAVLALGAALWWRKALVFAAFAALCAWLATGLAHPVSPFAVLKALPFYETFRYPERFLIPGGLFLALLGAMGLTAVLARARRQVDIQPVALALCVFAVVGWGLQLTNFHILSRRATFVAVPERVDQPFAQARGNRWVQAHFVALNRGSISCGEAFPVPMSPRLRGDLPQEEYLESSDAGTARRVRWSPNQIVVDVALDHPTHLLVNQNWHPGWRASVGEVVSREGLLAVRLPEGHHEVTLTFLPRSAIGGGMVSLVAFIALGVVGRDARRRGGRSRPLLALGASLVPLAVWGAVALAWDEPRLEPVLQNPNGAPLRVEALPEDAVPVGATWEVPVTLEAARIDPAPDEDGLVHMAFFWRITGKAPRTLGIFVHLVGPDGTFKNADHPVLGGTWFFDRAPREVLIQDAFGANASDYAPGEWKVYAGLWHASGDGSRVRMFDRHGAPATDRRLEVGRFTVPPMPGPAPEQESDQADDTPDIETSAEDRPVLGTP